MIQSRNVTVYTTTDGRDFTNEIEAVAHQAQVDADARINAFVATRNFESEAAATRTRNLIRDWVAFASQAA